MSERLKAIISAIVIVIVEIAGMFNLTLDNGTVELAITGVCMVIVLGWGIWKNHNFTDAAAVGQILVDGLKRKQPEILETVAEAAEAYTAKHAAPEGGADAE